MNRFLKGMVAGAVILIAGFCLVVLVIASNTGQSFGSVIRGWIPDNTKTEQPAVPDAAGTLTACGLTPGE